MLEILQDFESAVGGDVGLSPLVLIGPGLVCVIVGLFIWLGGLGFRKLLVAVVGVIIGSMCGFFIVGRNFISAAFSAALAAVIAIIFERLFIAIITGILAMVFTFIILAGPYVENTQELTPISSDQVSAQSSALSIRESAEKMKAYIVNAVRKIKQTCLQMPVFDGLIIMVLALIFMVVGFLFKNVASALCFSILGTVLIFAGLILLLLYKGAVPVRIICSKQSYYAIVFLAMTAFGTFEQLLLCQRQKKSSAGKKQTAKVKQQPHQTQEKWRAS